jgi:hypothetical protein
MARRRLLRTMKVRAPMPMRAALTNELATARDAFAIGGDGWRHLERAHVLSQPWAWDHVRVHATMLRRAWDERDRVELHGQLLRLVVAGPGSLANRYPIGNVGRARVSATTPMAITDDDVRAALTAAGQPTGT